MKMRGLTICSLAALSVTATFGEKVAFDQLPAPVQETVRVQAGAAAIEDIDRQVKDGQNIYEVAFKRDGQHTEVAVHEDGSVVGAAAPVVAASVAAASTNVTLSGATKVQFSAAPLVVQRTARAQAGTSLIEDVDMGSFGGRRVYQVGFKDATTGAHRELFIGEDGALLQAPTTNPAIAVAQIGFNDTPEKVRDALEIHSQNARVPFVNKHTILGKEYYHAQVVLDGKPTDIRVDSEGYPVDDRFRRTTSGVLMPLTNKKKIQVSQAPPVVQNAMKTQAGDAPIEDVDVGMWNGRTVYEIAFKSQDKHTEVQVDQDGAVLADQRMNRVNIGVGAAPSAVTGAQVISTTPPAATTPAVGTLQENVKLQFSQLPPAIQRAATAYIGSNAVDDIDRTFIDGKIRYEIGYKDTSEVHKELILDSRGRLISNK